jgi:hypothetical protein
MSGRKYSYIPVRLPAKLRARVLKIAKSENRGIGRQAEILVGLGLAEYERRQAGEKAGGDGQ